LRCLAASSIFSRAAVQQERRTRDALILLGTSCKPQGRLMFKNAVVLALTAGLGLTATATHAATLENVKEKGYLQCGVTEGVLGFSAQDASRNWSGLEVDFCRAMA